MFVSVLVLVSAGNCVRLRRDGVRGRDAVLPVSLGEAVLYEGGVEGMCLTWTAGKEAAGAKQSSEGG